MAQTGAFHPSSSSCPELEHQLTASNHMAFCVSFPALESSADLMPDYFCYCEVGFTERVLGDHIITMVREGNAEYGCNVYE